MGVVFTVCVTLVDVFIRKHRHIVSNLLITVITLAGILANIMAPGTAIRQGMFGGHMNPVKAIYLSIIYGIHRVFEHFDFKLIIVIIVLLPVIVSMVQPLVNKGIKFQYPMIFFVASVGWICCMLFPPLYGMHSTGPNRLANIVYFHFIILAFMNVFYFVGWIICKLKQEEKLININRFWCISMCILAFGLFVYGKNDMWSVKAVEELTQNIPQQFSKEAYAMDTLLKDSKGQDVVADAYSVTSELLYYEGNTDDPNYWSNTQTAKYYELKSIVVK